MTKITVFDGADTIGGNKIYLEEKENGLFLDFGFNFKKSGEFFQDFLSDRTIRGLHDLVALDLIPKLNIYRKDLIPSDLDVTSFKKLNLNAILLTHAHLDHYGNIGLLKSEYPIVASPSTIALLKSFLDTSSPKLGSEVAYYSPRTLSSDTRLLKSEGVKGSDIGRDFLCTTKVGQSLVDLMSDTQKSKKGFEPGDLVCIDDNPLPFEIQSFEVDHSIYGSTAYILSKDITVAYTGDFRLHGKRGDKSKNFIQHAKDASVLIIEGTRAKREDTDESEKMVYENCLKVVEGSKGLVVADFSGRNFERLEIFQEIADKKSRKLVITAKDAYLLKALQTSDGVDRIKDALIFKELKGSSKNWEKDIHTLMESKLLDPLELTKNPDKYLVCFSLYDLKNFLDLKPNGGTYIYSSSEAFEEEAEFDFIRLHKWLKFFGFDIYGFDLVADGDMMKPTFMKGYHASGHASKTDLTNTIETIDPDVIIPVHTDNPAWFKENFEKAKVLKNGQSWSK